MLNLPRKGIRRTRHCPRSRTGTERANTNQGLICMKSNNYLRKLMIAESLLPLLIREQRRYDTQDYSIKKISDSLTACQRGKPMHYKSDLKVVPKLTKAILVLLFSSSAVAQSKTWTTSTFLDLVDGSFSDGGANTYVTAAGDVVLINRRDINRDGNIDVVFPNDHDPNEKEDLLIYWGGDRFTSRHRMRLPTDGGSDGLVADLNLDGFSDLIVANNFNGTKTDLDSYIYWGSRNGLNSSKRSELPTYGARAVAVGDLNQDGHPDIVFANSGLGYHVTVDRDNRSFIYWGSSNGYSAERHLVVKTINCRDVAIADLNGDRYPDLVFANEGNSDEEGGALIYWGTTGGAYNKTLSTHLPGERSSAVAVADLNQDGFPEIAVANSYRLKTREMGMYNIVDTVSVDSYVYWGSKDGYSVGSRTSLPTVGASDVNAADLNQDKHLDLLFANHSGTVSYIYWGSTTGFRPHRRTSLPTHHPTRSTIEDFNQDGYVDLVFAQREAEPYQRPQAYIYWGGEDGFSADVRSELPTSEATGVLTGDLNADGETDLVFINAADTNRPNPTYIYWGDDDGGFDAGRRKVLPSGGGFCSTTDIDHDGDVDLLFASIDDAESGAGIYWAEHGSYSSRNRTMISSQGAFSSRVADFNRDGHLDISLTQWAPGQEATNLYWGGPAGFSGENRFVFPIGSLRGHVIGDLNRDDWLDIIFSTTNNQVVIYWNSPLGFHRDRKIALPGRVSASVEVADLNRDGFLDVIVPNLYDADPSPNKPQSFGGSPEGDTFIYWGGSGGYDVSRRIILPSVGNSDVAVADLNGNGLLDMVLTSYHAGYTRSHPSTIYWNSSNGFNASRATQLPTNSASGVHVNDFDRNGHADILFACHSKEGNHRNDSFLYWGSQAGFSTERRTLLPGLGPHHLTSDAGHVYDRGNRYDYVSPPFDAGSRTRPESISWDGSTPFNTALEFQVRWADTREALTAAPWNGPKGSKSYYTESGASLVSGTSGARWMQYKASLVSPGSASSPVLRSVSIRYRSIQ